MRIEVLDKRAALLEAHRSSSVSNPAQAELVSQIADLKHRLLTSRDHAIGAEAAAASATRERDDIKVKHHEFILEAGRRTAGLEQEIQDLKKSQRWRVGGWVAAPAKMIKRMAGR
jgi:hypothetical protein